MIPSFLRSRLPLMGNEHISKKLSPKSRFRNSKLKMSRKNFSSHGDLASRLEKTLYYGELPRLDAVSFNLASLAVEVFTDLELYRSFESINHDFVSRLSHNAVINPCSVVMAFLYVDRLQRMNPDYLHSTTSSKLFLVSVMVASKFLYDEGEDEEVRNEEWAESAGLDTEELNVLEREFLNAINWSVFVNSNDFHRILSQVEAYIAWHETINRGWLTYTDFDCLSSWLSNTFSLTWESIVKNSLGMFILYSAYVATVILSAFLFLECNKICCSMMNSTVVGRNEDTVSISIFGFPNSPNNFTLPNDDMDLSSFVDSPVNLSFQLYLPTVCHKSPFSCYDFANGLVYSKDVPPLLGTVSV